MRDCRPSRSVTRAPFGNVETTVSRSLLRLEVVRAEVLADIEVDREECLKDDKPKVE